MPHLLMNDNYILTKRSVFLLLPIAIRKKLPKTIKVHRHNNAQLYLRSGRAGRVRCDSNQVMWGDTPHPGLRTEQTRLLSSWMWTPFKRVNLINPYQRVLQSHSRSWLWLLWMKHRAAECFCGRREVRGNKPHFCRVVKEIKNCFTTIVGKKLCCIVSPC